MGDAELSGTAKAEKSVLAPFSGQECVFCSYAVEVPDRNGWRRVDHGQMSSVFYLDDGTGEILINPEGSTFYGPATYQRVYTFSEAMLQPGIAAWLQMRKQASWAGALSDGVRHRFIEYLLAPGQIVFVEGAVSTVRHVVDGREREEMVVGRRASGHYVLSAFSEEKLLSDFSWKVPCQIFGGAAVLLGCLWYLVWRLQLERFIN